MEDAVGLRVTVVEGQEVVRRGLMDMVSNLDDVRSCTAHRSFGEALDGEGRGVDVVILGSCPDRPGADGVAEARGRGVRVLVLVTSEEPGHLANAANVSADGYLMLGELTERALEFALRQIVTGSVSLPAPLASFLLDSARTKEPSIRQLETFLSPRERDVLALVVEGLSNQQIAHRLSISIHGAKRHVSSILNKLNSPSRAHVVSKALQAGLVPTLVAS